MRTSHLLAGTVLCLLLACEVAAAADRVRGILVVNGTTTALRHVYVTLDHDADDAEAQFQTILLADRPVEPADRRSPARLKALAGAGRLHAVRILWRRGYDGVLAAPYDASLAECGRAVQEHPTIEFKAMSDDRLEARIHSKMLGQAWHYDATISAAIVPGGPLDLEAPATAPSTRDPAPGTATTGDAAKTRKLELGRLGYEFSDEAYERAVADGNDKAVRAFLALGKSPNAMARQDPMLVYATSFCGNRPGPGRTAVILALVEAGADVTARNDIDATPLLDAVQYECELAVVKALLAKGADPHAKAKGGATPLLMAGWMQRTAMLPLLNAARTPRR